MITPWYRRLSVPRGGGDEVSGAITATRILDHDAAVTGRLVERSRDTAAAGDDLAVLGAAHTIISAEVRPVYAIAENTAASVTLERAHGSCSQRLAVLESVARSIGVATRVRALLIDRAFWYPRFPHLRLALPDSILLVWPEFDVGVWRSASELFGPIGCRGGGSFANRGSETLFEAAGRCAIDWDGKSADSAYDLSRFVRADHGYFTHRDDAFAALGQTLCTPTRLVMDPVLRRIAA